MEIQFNPSQTPKAELPQVAVRQGAPAAAADSISVSAPSSTTASLQDKLNAIPLVRQDKVDQGTQLVSDDNFPPGYYEERIAVLLAVHVKL
jgi:hypothetical protein